MNRILISILLLLSNLSYGKAQFSWDYVKKNGIAKLLNKKHTITGELSDIKRHIRARDTFYTFFVNDPDSDEKILVKLYTILKLKRVNKFKCENSQLIKIKSTLYKSRKQIARMTIKEKAPVLECKDSEKND
tara:strand:+ start:130 stop:525 length:396 start_codon:yes stop_codon:yes gene_type:complete